MDAKNFHTSGSWFDSGSRVIALGENPQCIAHVVTGNPADARLLARAPMLLAALHDIVALAIETPRSPTTLWEIAKAAIAAIDSAEELP
jgi:hypothetical protein